MAASQEKEEKATKNPPKYSSEQSSVRYKGPVIRIVEVSVKLISFSQTSQHPGLTVGCKQINCEVKDN